MTQASSRFACVSLDCADPDALGEFYRELLGGVVLWRSHSSIGVQAPGVVLAAQRVTGHRPPAWPGASVVHLDLDAGPDPGAAVERAVRLGATQSPVQPDPRWVVLLDPAGHPFCLTTLVPDTVPDAQALGTLSFGYPGDGGLGDRLLTAVMRGAKTATSSLAVEYLGGQPLPRVGEVLALTDHEGRRYGTARTTRVQITPLHLVGDEVAQAEGEDYADAAAWRRGHERFWRDVTDLIRVDCGDSAWTLRDSEPVVVHWFELVVPG